MRHKFLSIFVMLLGLIILSPGSVYGNVAAATNGEQRIYSVTEIDSPSPYHITFVVRTGLNTGEVWIQGADGGFDRGLLISYGESQQVWQISYMPNRNGAFTIVINANHALVMDESVVSQIFRIGQSAIISTTDETRVSEQVITVSNRGLAEQTVSTTTVWRGINIIGDDQFVQRTLRAMEAVEGGPQWAYYYIVTYLDYVRQHSTPRRASAGGHINVRTRTFYVYNRTYTANVMWYASALVHEAVHARQFREYLESYGSTPPRRITFYTTFDEQMRIEMEALDIQIRFLEEAGASRHVVDAARSFIGTVWWR